MTVLCVDDHPVIVNGLKSSISQLLPQAQVHAFTKAKDALHYARKNGCDVLLCEIELYDHGGIRLAENIRMLNPFVNIIFVTVCSQQEYANEIMQLRPSGYLTKPATQGQLAAELERLRYPVVS